MVRGPGDSHTRHASARRLRTHTRINWQYFFHPPLRVLVFELNLQFVAMMCRVISNLFVSRWPPSETFLYDLGFQRRGRDIKTLMEREREREREKKRER